MLYLIVFCFWKGLVKIILLFYKDKIMNGVKYEMFI